MASSSCSSRSGACPDSRRAATAAVAPGIASPETCSTPSTSRRMHAMGRESIRVTRSVSVDPDEIELGSPARPVGGTAREQGGARVEAVFDVEELVPDAGSEAPCGGPLGSGAPCGGPGRAEPGAEPRARRRTARREARRGAQGGAAAGSDTADGAARERRLAEKRRRAHQAPPSAPAAGVGGSWGCSPSL